MRRVALICCVALLGCGEAKEPARQRPAKETPGKGSDWPGFLGPAGTSVSAEKGILAPWPRDGLRVVWHRRTFEGYAAPSVANGRLYLFEHQGNTARLNCLRGRDRRFVWKFEYPTEYADRYRYSGGPRCCPVVDDDRVYLYGPEGMLHCLRSRRWQARLESGHPQGLRLRPELLRRRQHARRRGRSAYCPGWRFAPGQRRGGFRQGEGQRQRRGGLRQANWQGEVAAVERVGELCQPGAGDHWQAALVFRVCSRRPGRSRPGHRQGGLPFSLAGTTYESANASSPVVVGDKVFLSETYGPGSVLLQVKPGGYKVLWSDKNKGRDKSMQCHWMTPIYHDGYLYG